MCMKFIYVSEFLDYFEKTLSLISFVFFFNGEFLSRQLTVLGDFGDFTDIEKNHKITVMIANVKKTFSIRIK